MKTIYILEWNIYLRSHLSSDYRTQLNSTQLAVELSWELWSLLYSDYMYSANWPRICLSVDQPF